ncbi:MAG: phosphatase PAP2 family protein [Lachnospiraceae bacterium]|nr:phosphatase PAP2 family protein [Lachnospiraceae bacterium]
MSLRERINQIVPYYAWLPLFVTVFWNMLVYFGSRPFTSHLYHYDVSLPIDARIPLIPWTVFIYFTCYLFWIVNYVLAVRVSKKACYRFICAEILGKTICLLFFVFFPTTAVRPMPIGTTFWDNMLKNLYIMDAADNLFPSIHCFVSWMCVVGIRKSTIPNWYKVVSVLCSLMVFVSVLTTKQHVFVDVIGGVLLAEGCYFFVEKSGIWQGFGIFMRRCGRRLKLPV